MFCIVVVGHDIVKERLWSATNLKHVLPVCNNVNICTAVCCTHLFALDSIRCHNDTIN